MRLRVAIAEWIVESVVPPVFRVLNPLASRLLRTPLHPLVTWYVCEVEFPGRRTGATYRIPLAYHRDFDGALEAVTTRQGRWWRNLADGDVVQVLHKGRRRKAWLELSVGDTTRIQAALDRRERWRRALLPFIPDRTVLLRLNLEA